MPTDSGWFVFLLVLVLVWLAATARRWLHSALCRTAITAPIQPLLKPRTPDDCPTCRQQVAPPGSVPLRPPLPWREQKSRRRAPNGSLPRALPAPIVCVPSYRMSDPQLHALVGDGAYGQCQRSQTFRCQACATTFSTRRGYPLGDATLWPENFIPTCCRDTDR